MTTPTTPAADASLHRNIVLRLNDEADLCRNDGANDIAALLDDAAKHIQTRALEFLSAEAQADERESALVAERDALRAALVADAEFAKALIGHEEYCERAYAEGWDNDPTGSSHLASSAYRVSAMRIKAEEMKAAALALAAPAVEGE